MNPATLFKKSDTETSVQKTPAIQAYNDMVAEGISRSLKKQKEGYDAEIERNRAAGESIIYKVRHAVTKALGNTLGKTIRTKLAERKPVDYSRK